MGESEDKVVCFQCGRQVLEPGAAPLPSGVAGDEAGEAGETGETGETSRACKACADRLLDQLPPIFHTPWGRAAEPARTSDDYSAQDYSGTEDYSGEGA